MAPTDLLHPIDTEIEKLQQARALLLGGTATASAPVMRRGRPKESKNAANAVAVQTRKPLSPEAKAKIAAAQKRWAKAKKAP